jgi:3-oxoacyl-[acyl-carrier protein] reductase
MGRLDGQTALVTGGGRGIGRAIVKKLASEGANVVINYGTSDRAAKETADLCRKEYGVKTLVVQADVSRPEDMKRLFEEAKALTGKVEILVNNAGITADNLILRMTDEDFDRVQKINLYGTFYGMKLAAKTMLRQRYGRIISLSSVVGLHGNAGQVNYAASKAGIVGMTKALAKEMASRGVTVNGVAPGMIETDMTAAMTEAAHKAMEGQIPAGRMGSPEDIAEAVAFFADPASGYVTGQILAVDGGMAL